MTTMYFSILTIYSTCVAVSPLVMEAILLDDTGVGLVLGVNVYSQSVFHYYHLDTGQVSNYPCCWSAITKATQTPFTGQRQAWGTRTRERDRDMGQRYTEMEITQELRNSTENQRQWTCIPNAGKRKELWLSNSVCRWVLPVVWCSVTCTMRCQKCECAWMRGKETTTTTELN